MPERPKSHRTKMVGATCAALVVVLAVVLLAFQRPWDDTRPHYPLPLSKTAHP